MSIRYNKQYYQTPPSDIDGPIGPNTNQFELDGYNNNDVYLNGGANRGGGGTPDELIAIPVIETTPIELVPTPENPSPNDFFVIFLHD